jgi:hypothetical protein
VSAAFAVTMNGRTSSELKPRWAEEEIVNLLSRLDGVDRYSMILWELPENIPFDRVDINDYPHEYVQCAGSFEARLTAEPGPANCRPPIHAARSSSELLDACGEPQTGLSSRRWPRHAPCVSWAWPAA